MTTGTWNLTVAGINLTCIDPASGGTASTFYENVANTYTVECEAQSGVSGTSAYPTSIAIASGSLPADGNPTFATSTSSSPACTHHLGIGRHRGVHPRVRHGRDADRGRTTAPTP